MAATHQPDPPAAAALQKQPRRPVNRIIPAVPHRFSRPPAARPLTPEESTTVTQRKPDPDAKTVPAPKRADPEPAAAPETPLTPESHTSPADEQHNGDAHALASSPAHSPEDQVASRTHSGFLPSRKSAQSS